jgi:hypothetical protein
MLISISVRVDVAAPQRLRRLRIADHGLLISRLAIGN